MTVHSFGTTKEEGYIGYMEMEYAKHGDLFDFLGMCGVFPESIAKHYLTQLITAVDAVSKLGYAHLDIRPENILIMRDLTLKIGDFGLCT